MLYEIARNAAARADECTGSQLRRSPAPVYADPPTTSRRLVVVLRVGVLVTELLLDGTLGDAVRPRRDLATAATSPSGNVVMPAGGCEKSKSGASQHSPTSHCASSSSSRARRSLASRDRINTPSTCLCAAQARGSTPPSRDLSPARRAMDYLQNASPLVRHAHFSALRAVCVSCGHGDIEESTNDILLCDGVFVPPVSTHPSCTPSAAASGRVRRTALQRGMAHALSPCATRRGTARRLALPQLRPTA